MQKVKNDIGEMEVLSQKLCEYAKGLVDAMKVQKNETLTARNMAISDYRSSAECSQMAIREAIEKANDMLEKLAGKKEEISKSLSAAIIIGDSELMGKMEAEIDRISREEFICERRKKTLENALLPGDKDTLRKAVLQIKETENAISSLASCATDFRVILRELIASVDRIAREAQLTFAGENRVLEVQTNLIFDALEKTAKKEIVLPSNLGDSRYAKERLIYAVGGNEDRAFAEAPLSNVLVELRAMLGVTEED